MKSIFLSLTLFAVAAGIYLLLHGGHIRYGNIFACSVFIAVAMLWAVEALNLKPHKSGRHSNWHSTGLSKH